MSISPFVFSSENLPRRKAKQLFKTFPFLKLSDAQEATARALGYTSWYECINRGMSGEPSLSDQEAGRPVRASRYYHQAGVLIGLGITPSDADLWVRAWGLTGRPTLAPTEGVPLYYRWNDALERLDRGEISEEQMVDEFGDGGWSKYPDVDRPQRVCPGVILGPCGKYPHYAVDPAINARIPIYLRGPAALYHIEDDADVLAMTIEGFSRDALITERIFPRLNRVQYEWHYGAKHPESSELCLPPLEAAALAAPDAMVVISMRPMPAPNDGYDFDRYALACLRGRDFATFLREKGVIYPENVVWYGGVHARNLRIFPFELYSHIPLPVFVDADKYQPSLPLYSYPFMAAPMHSDEYSMGIERVCLLPLDEDYDEDDDEGGALSQDPEGPPPVPEDPLVDIWK